MICQLSLWNVDLKSFGKYPGIIQVGFSIEFETHPEWFTSGWVVYLSVSSRWGFPHLLPSYEHSIPLSIELLPPHFVHILASTCLCSKDCQCDWRKCNLKAVLCFQDLLILSFTEHAQVPEEPRSGCVRTGVMASGDLEVVGFGVKLRYSGKVTSDLNCWVISPAHPVLPGLFVTAVWGSVLLGTLDWSRTQRSACICFTSHMLVLRYAPPCPVINCNFNLYFSDGEWGLTYFHMFTGCLYIYHLRTICSFH